MIAHKTRVLALALGLATAAAALTPAGCEKDRVEIAVSPTVATAEVLHAGVSVAPARGAAQRPRVEARVEAGGRVTTESAGRAVVRTDEGLEVRMAGDTELDFAEGRPRLLRGRAFVSSWGEEERTLLLGPDLVLALGDAAVEIERTPSGQVRAIAVRGEFAWRRADRQGRVRQGEALEGQGSGAPALRAAGVWDDWTGGAASPQGTAHRGALGAGEALIHGDPGEMPLELAVNEHHVSVRVEGDVAITTVSQRFFNGADRTAPVEYRVRLPEGAIVAGFSVEQNGLVRYARPGSVAASSATGGYAALLAAPDGGYFARLDALAPGQTLRCELTYVEWLQHREGRRTYVYPMGDPVSPPFVGEFTFDMSLQRANVAAIRGPAGSLVERERLRYARSDFRPRADFYVDLFDRTAPESASARIWVTPPGSYTRHALVDVNLPAPPERGTDLVVVLDVSGATDTGTLSVASAALNAILHQLGPDDRISLMLGDLGARPAPGTAGDLATVSDVRREAILEAVSRARPGGASNLARMITDAYARLDPRRNGSVIYMGDAMPTMGPLDAERLSDETLRAAPDLRLYVLALGVDAHPEMLAPLAARGGLSLWANDQAEAVTAANRLAAHAMRPVLRDVRVLLGSTFAHPLPAVQEIWVAGEPLRVVGELTGNPPERVTITARAGSEEQRWTVATRIDGVMEAGDIRRRWGLSRVRALEAQGASRGTLADLGVRFGLITSTSALVLAGPGLPVSEGGYEVAASLWPEADLRTRLPRLGISENLEPRGVRALYEVPEHPMVSDDESGWRRHSLGEGAGSHDELALALSAADDDVRACVERSRALRPNIQGRITVSATIAADGRVTAATIVSSTLNDTAADACVRRVIAGLTLPPPETFGVRPGTAQRTFDFTRPWISHVNRNCPPSSRLPRNARMALWRERIESNRGQLAQVWADAMNRCELRIWEDRVALVQLLARAARDPSELAPLRATLDGEEVKYLDRVAAHRWGPSHAYRAYLAQARGYIDWDSLMRRLGDPQLPATRKIELIRAYLLLSPGDMDLRLRLMALHEQAAERTSGTTREAHLREARRVAEGLRADPYADTRVRTLVGEMLIRTGERVEGLRVLSEIAEHAPYDTHARARLGDLLLTYGGQDWADEAYLQYETLAALRPGDPLPRVRLALAALVARREDEALRILRAVAEDAGGDANAPAVEGLFVSEVARLAASRGNDAASQHWVRVANLMHIAREGGVMARWTHPDVVLELRAMQSGDTAFVGVGNGDSPLNVRVFSPGTALEGSRLLLRAVSGLDGSRSTNAHLVLLRPDERGPRVIEREVTLTPSTRVLAFVVRNGALIDDPTPIPDAERPGPTTEIY